MARASIALAEIHRELYGTEVDTDILLAAALVDDGNKFFDFYASKEGPLKPTRFRTLLPVSAYSVHK